MKILVEDQLQHWVNRLGFVLRRDLQDRFRRADMRLGAEEWAVLLLLWQDDGQTPGELALRTVKDQTTMTRLLDGLARKGFVDRMRDHMDRRKVRVVLTPQGNEIQGHLVPIAADLIKASEAGISDADIQTTRRVLQKMTENLLETGGKNV